MSAGTGPVVAEPNRVVVIDRTSRAPRLYGAIARFDGPGALLEAAAAARRAGYRRTDAYSPFPVHGIDEAMGMKRSKLPVLVLCTALMGGSGAWLLMAYLSAVEYPLIIGGKPYNSTEAFIPIIFESTILLGAFGAVFGMLGLNGLPKLFHPTALSPSFHRATDDGFFLTIEARDKRFDPVDTLEFLRGLGGTDVELLDAE